MKMRPMNKAKPLGQWGAGMSFQAGGFIGCGLGLVGLLAGGWAPLAAVGVAAVATAGAFVVIYAIDSIARTSTRAINEATVSYREQTMPYRSAKKESGITPTTMKVATGAMAVAFAGSVVLSGGGDSSSSGSSGARSSSSRSGEPSATLTVSGNTVWRSEVSNLDGCGRGNYSSAKNLGWEISYADGSHLLSRNANNEFSLVFDEDSPAFNHIVIGKIRNNGGYATVWLECWVDGGSKAISNTVKVYPNAHVVQVIPTARPSNSSGSSSSSCEMLVVGNNVRLRKGPGSNYDSAGSISGGQTVTPIGRVKSTDGGTWYALGRSQWIAGLSLATSDPRCARVPITPLCGNNPPTRLVGLSRARVTPGDPNNIRDAPESRNILGQIPGGAEFKITGDPVCGPGTGLAWWPVEYRGIRGWTPEGSGSTYWLAPLN